MKKIALLAGVAFCLSTTACRKNFFEPEPTQQPDAVFETLWRSFETDYGPFAERGVDWQAAYEQYRPQVSATSTDEELFAALTGLLGTFDDGHVNLFAPNRVAFNSNRIRNQLIDNELFDLELVERNYLTSGFETDADTTFVYGLLPGNVVYLHLPFVSGNVTALNRALDRFPNAEGLIVDLRHNDGGDFTWPFSEWGRLTAERRLVFSSRTKNGPDANDYTAWREWFFEPKGPFFNHPVVLLTDRYTISAGERTAAALQTLPNCTTVGDTTCGAFATMVGGELANGWKYTLPVQNTRLSNGQSCEGVGLPPDVVVKNSKVEMQNGHDRVLETALDLFK